MNDKLRIIQFQYIFLINRISKKYLKGFIISIGVHAPQSSEKCIYLIRTDVTVIKTDVTVIKTDVTVIRTDVII